MNEYAAAAMIVSVWFPSAALMAGMVIAVLLLLTIFIAFRDEFLVFRKRSPNE